MRYSTLRVSRSKDYAPLDRPVRDDGAGHEGIGDAVQSGRRWTTEWKTLITENTGLFDQSIDLTELRRTLSPVDSIERVELPKDRVALVPISYCESDSIPCTIRKSSNGRAGAVVFLDSIQVPSYMICAPCDLW